MSGIKLTTPQTKPVYYDEVILQGINWKPEQKTVTISLSLGYKDGMGNWIETKQDIFTVRNIPANPSNPSNPVYDNFKLLLEGTNLKLKPLDIVILEKLVLKQYPGTILP